MKKRLLSLVLCLVMVFSLFPSFAAPAMAADNYVSVGTGMKGSEIAAFNQNGEVSDADGTTLYYRENGVYYPVVAGHDVYLTPVVRGNNQIPMSEFAYDTTQTGDYGSGNQSTWYYYYCVTDYYVKSGNSAIPFRYMITDRNGGNWYRIIPYYIIGDTYTYYEDDYYYSDNYGYGWYYKDGSDQNSLRIDRTATLYEYTQEPASNVNWVYFEDGGKQYDLAYDLWGDTDVVVYEELFYKQSQTPVDPTVPTGTVVTDSGLTLDKTASKDANTGTYTLNLSAEQTGMLTEQLSEGTPADVVFVVDQSATMATNDMTSGFQKANKTAWKAADIAGGTYYYALKANPSTTNSNDYAPVTVETGATYTAYKSNPVTITDDIITGKMNQMTYGAAAGYDNDSGWAYSHTGYYVYDSSVGDMREVYVRTKGYTAYGGGYGAHFGGFWAQFFYVKNTTGAPSTILDTSSTTKKWFTDNRDSGNALLLEVSGKNTHGDYTGDYNREQLATATKIDNTFNLNAQLYTLDARNGARAVYYGDHQYLRNTENQTLDSLAKNVIYNGDLYYYEASGVRMDVVKNKLKNITSAVAAANPENRVAVVGFSGNDKPLATTTAYFANRNGSNRLYYTNTGFFDHSTNKFLNFKKESLSFVQDNTTAWTGRADQSLYVTNNSNYTTAFKYWKISKLEGGFSNLIAEASYGKRPNTSGIGDYYHYYSRTTLATSSADGFVIQDVLSNAYHVEWINSSDTSRYYHATITTTGGAVIEHNDTASSTRYNYVNNSYYALDFTDADYANALTNSAAKAETAINGLYPYGTERDASLGLTMANNIFAASGSGDRQRIVVFVTDGENSSYTEAAKQQAAALKQNYNATVYAIGVGSNAAGLQSYLSQISSEYYPTTGSTSSQAKVHDGGFTAAAANAFDVDSLIVNIADRISTRTRERMVPSSTVLKDYINVENFDARSAQVTVTGGGTAQIDTNPDSATYGLVTVTGHDYANGPLSVQITGLKPTRLGELETNTRESGVYLGDTMLEPFPVPTVEVKEDPKQGDLYSDKTISSVKDDGTYDITMSAFATGNYVQTEEQTIDETAPMDIVLVVDQSGSMGTKDMGDEYKSVTGPKNGGWTVADATAGETYYYKLGDRYYPVQAETGTVYEKVDSPVTVSDMFGWGHEGVSFAINGSPTHFGVPTDYYVKDRNGNLQKLFLITVARELHYSLYPYIYTSDATANEVNKSEWTKNIYWVALIRPWNASRLKDDATWSSLVSSNHVSFVNTDGQTVGASDSAGDSVQLKYSWISSSSRMSNIYQVADSKQANRLVYVDDSGNRVPLPGSSQAQFSSDVVYSGVLYRGDSISRVEAMKSAVTEFIDTVKTKSPNSKMAIIGFAGNMVPAQSSGETAYDTTKFDYTNSGLFVNNDFLNYEQIDGYSVYNGTRYINRHYYVKSGSDYQPVRYDSGAGRWYNVVTEAYVSNSATFYQPNYEQITANDYKDALVSISSSELTDAVAQFGYYGGTYTSYGMTMANQLLENTPVETNRDRLVIVFTDGEPGGNGYEASIAGEALLDGNRAKIDQNATVYTVGLFKGGVKAQVEQFMRQLSSEYTVGKKAVNGGTANYGLGSLNANKTYYYIDNATNKAFAVTTERNGKSTLGWWVRNGSGSGEITSYSQATPRTRNGSGNTTFYNSSDSVVYADAVNTNTVYYTSSGDQIVYEYRWFDSNGLIRNPIGSGINGSVQFYEMDTPVVNTDGVEYYMRATDEDSLKNVFRTISTTISGGESKPVSTVSYNAENSYLMDEITADFDLPADLTGKVEVYTRDVLIDHVDPDTGVQYIQKTTIQKDGEDVEVPVFDTREEALTPVPGAQVAWNGKQLIVSNYDYAMNYSADGHPGKELVVIVRGLKPNHSGVQIPSNTMKSGIYGETKVDDNTEIGLVSQFPVPRVDVDAFTVTWNTHDQQLLETDADLLYADTAKYDGETPVRESVTTGDTTTTYTFIGWSDAPTGTNVVVAPGAEVTVTASKDYYAVYEAHSETLQRYTVNWMDTDGTTVLQGPDSLLAGTVPEYTELTVPEKTSADPSKVFTFVGWSTDSAAEYAGDVTPFIIDDPVETYAAGGNSVTFYPVFAERSVSEKTVVVEYSAKHLISDDVHDYAVVTDDLGSFRLEGVEKDANGVVTQAGSLYFTPKGEKVRYDYDLTAMSKIAKAQYFDGPTEALDTNTTTVTVIPGSSIYLDDTLTTKTTGTADANGIYNYSAVLENANADEDSTEQLEKNAQLRIRFTGTRIDLYCSTTTNGQVVRAWVEDGNGKIVKDGDKSLLVSMKNQSAEDRYNVPTVSFTMPATADGKPGTYTLVLNDYYGDYKLDGVRVYNSVAELADTVEENAHYVKLRDKLVDGLAALLEKQDRVPAISFHMDVGTDLLSDYVKEGPKNEIYLDAKEWVAFEIEHFDLYQGTPRVMVGLSVQHAGDDATVQLNNNETQHIKAVTDSYYTVNVSNSGADCGIVYIKNLSNVRVAITNLKITGVDGVEVHSTDNSGAYATVQSVNDEPAAQTEAFEPNLIVTRRLMSFMENPVFSEPPADPEPTPSADPEPTPTADPEPTHQPSLQELLSQLFSSFVQNLFKGISRLFGN